MSIKDKQQKAIEILNRQIGKLDDPKYPVDETWKVQTATYIREYFGEPSEQYEYIKNFKVRGAWNEIVEWNKQHKDSGKRFLRECIQVIENIGLYRSPRENILKTMSHEALISWLSAIILVTFSLGFYIGNINSNSDRYELKEELKSKNDSLKIYRNNIKDLNKQLKATKPKATKANKQAS